MGGHALHLNIGVLLHHENIRGARLLAAFLVHHLLLQECLLFVHFAFHQVLHYTGIHLQTLIFGGFMEFLRVGDQGLGRRD